MDRLGWCAKSSLLKNGNGATRKMPYMKSPEGIQSQRVADYGTQRRRPQLGKLIGVHSHQSGTHRKRPMLGRPRGLHSRESGMPNSEEVATDDGILSYFLALRNRLRRVRVCCGDWQRVLGPSPTHILGTTAIFLDPPYSDLADRREDTYAEDSLSVAHDVREWAIANGENPLLRIALCGYEGEHVLPPSWSCAEWKANGGYANSHQAQGRANSHRERVWFSPHCLASRQPDMFD